MFNAIADALLPPASLSLIVFALLLAGPRFRRAGLFVLAAFLLLGTGLVSAVLLGSLTVPDPAPGPAPAAIVILSGDAILLAEDLPLQPGPLTLERMRAGYALSRETSLPVLVAGGTFLGSQTTLAAMMATSAHEDFGVDVRWEEDRSADTWQNAGNSASILQQAGIRRVYLVTHFWHMRRAVLAFRHFGLDPVPAPVLPPRKLRWSWSLLALTPGAWQTSYYALHEWLGLLFYSLRA